MKTFLVLLLFFISFELYSQQRKEIEIPNIPGYLTLKCDFHTHTVFSDGNVWPTIRVKEAWLEGLDALAITDHIEYRPHKNDITADHNRSYELAEPLATQTGVILIHGAEITRKMPPGHLNAIFITDANALEKDDWFDACDEARKQGAFVFWNHPGWKAQQPDKTLWWDEHTRLLKAGILKGIEVCNTNDFYPEALGWALEKNLTMLCNSDVHDPMPMAYDLVNSHRPVTLVFAKERTAESIREALDNGRTAAYYEQTIVGHQAQLGPLFFASIEVTSAPPHLANKLIKQVMIHNHSDIDLRLNQNAETNGFTETKSVTLPAHKTTVITLKGTSDEMKDKKTITLRYEVENMLIGVNQGLPVELEIPNR